jgi:Xaa-Pro aminopeptidase
MNDFALSALKKFLIEQKIDYFLLPNSDEFFGEYLPESEKRVEFLTGFSGSNATVIFGQRKSYFFTDGRYMLQAAQELDNDEFEIFNIATKSVNAWLEENLKSSQQLALFSKLTSVLAAKNLSKKFSNLVFLEKDFLAEIWQERAQAAASQVFYLDEKVAGENTASKRSRVLQGLAADALLISKPENLCWLLNARARDLEFTPLWRAYGILFCDGSVEVFQDENAARKILSKKIGKIQIDESITNYWLHQLLEKNGSEIIVKKDPIELLKAQKNSAEIFGAIKAHEVDGLALCRFLFWLENAGEIDEISAEKKLLEFRQKSPDFFSLSFNTISSFASNGAVIHHHATPKTNKKISGNSLYLVDSGGQYLGADFCGTTDVTRTIAIGVPSAEMIENFTRVLKGHIALARAKFPRGTTGAQLDALARFQLWQAKLDYDHGTGHGVGSFLSVHEGPCGVSRRAHQELLPGMIISNEPGFYKAGEYGIRLENLLLVKELDEKFLCFKTLTLAPFDARLIDMKMLTYPEKKWLKNYHEEIFIKLSPSLDLAECGWFKNFV